MVERIFDPIGLLILAIPTVAGFLLPVLIGLARGADGAEMRWRGLEGAILALLGGLLARTFVSLSLGAAGDSTGAGLALGWGLFLVPGIIDSISLLSGNGAILTTPDALLMFATMVGGLTGMMGGIWRTYDWGGLGWIAFPLDVTWALAGNTIGCLLHAINFAWGDHDGTTRVNVHHYHKGFGLRPGFAFTQGTVMSNLSDNPGTDLYRHERTHVWQNRGFGPMYTLTYLGWFIVWLIPAVVAGIIVQGIRGVWAGPNIWCYFNNPWETWAYAVQNAPRTNISGVTTDDAKMIWPAKFVIAWSIPFFLLATFLGGFAVVNGWSDSGQATASAAHGSKGSAQPLASHPGKPKPGPGHK